MSGQNLKIALAWSRAEREGCTYTASSLSPTCLLSAIVQDILLREWCHHQCDESSCINYESWQSSTEMSTDRPDNHSLETLLRWLHIVGNWPFQHYYYIVNLRSAWHVSQECPWHKQTKYQNKTSINKQKNETGGVGGLYTCSCLREYHWFWQSGCWVSWDGLFSFKFIHSGQLYFVDMLWIVP